MDWESFVSQCYAYLNTRVDEAMTNYHLGDYHEYVIDQESATIQFLDKGTPKLSASIQIVGSLSNSTQTWLWSWANNHVLAKAKDKMPIIHEYGQENGYEKLTHDKWTGDEVDGWEMTAIAAYLFQAQGAYRVPTEAGFVYLTMTDMHSI